MSVSQPIDAATIRELLAKIPEGPWFTSFDDAEECGPHSHSGLALVETGRESDWPIARLCEWPQANFIAKSVEIARYALELSDKAEELEQERETDLIGRLASMNADLLQQVESQAAELERLRGEIENLTVHLDERDTLLKP